MNLHTFKSKLEMPRWRICQKCYTALHTSFIQSQILRSIEVALTSGVFFYTKSIFGTMHSIVNLKYCFIRQFNTLSHQYACSKRKNRSRACLLINWFKCYVETFWSETCLKITMNTDIISVTVHADCWSRSATFFRFFSYVRACEFAYTVTKSDDFLCQRFGHQIGFNNDNIV